MMTYLSVQLKKYYRIIGNKIVFIGEKTLNQLALDMWEKLNYRGIDPSVLSRVIHGKRLFTYNQLKVFCQLLHITRCEKRLLKICLIRDMIERCCHCPHNPISLKSVFLKLDSASIIQLRKFFCSIDEHSHPACLAKLSAILE